SNIRLKDVAFMVLCQNCGKGNSPESQFCRFCGARIVVRQAVQQEYHQARPYAWKTDEFQTQNEARVSRTADHVMTPNQQMAPRQNYTPALIAYSAQQD